MKPDPRAGAQAFVSRPDLKPPEVFIARSEPGRTPGSVFLGPKGGRAMGPMILDDAGQLVWFRPVTGGRVAMDVRTQSYGGKPVLTWWEGRLFGGGGRGVGMVLDERYKTVKRVQMGNGFAADSHEFTITPQGTALMNAWDAIQRPEGKVLQSVVQEIDIATGLVLFEWHSAGNIAVNETYREREGTWDYLHLNSIALDPALNFVLSARSTNAIYKVSRERPRPGALAPRRQALVVLLRSRRIVRAPARRRRPRSQTARLRLRQRRTRPLPRDHAAAGRHPGRARAVSVHPSNLLSRTRRHAAAAQRQHVRRLGLEPLVQRVRRERQPGVGRAPVNRQ